MASHPTTHYLHQHRSHNLKQPHINTRPSTFCYMSPFLDRMDNQFNPHTRETFRTRQRSSHCSII